jgi:hypothetical protein
MSRVSIRTDLTRSSEYQFIEILRWEMESTRSSALHNQRPEVQNNFRKTANPIHGLVEPPPSWQEDGSCPWIAQYPG